MTKETTFTDYNVPFGGHCYSVSIFCENGITRKSNEICDVIDEGCDPPFDLCAELTNTKRAKLHWKAPLNENVTYYYIMRKTNPYGEWKRVRILSADETEYTDNVGIDADKCYYYRVVAKYAETECYSSPAKAKHSDEFFVKVCNSTDVEENESHNILIYPNPAKDVVKLSSVESRLTDVRIYNCLGMLIDEIEINVSDYRSGIYFINIHDDDGNVVTEKVLIIHNDIISSKLCIMHYAL